MRCAERRRGQNLPGGHHEGHSPADGRSCSALAGGVAPGIFGQTAGSVEAHVAAARAATAGRNTPPCSMACVRAGANAAAPPAGSAGPAGGTQPQESASRSQWHSDPAKVFDNLYYLGQTTVLQHRPSPPRTASSSSTRCSTIRWRTKSRLVATTLGWIGEGQIRPREPWSYRPCRRGDRFLQDRFGARVIMSPGWGSGGRSIRRGRSPNGTSSRQTVTSRWATGGARVSHTGSPETISTLIPEGSGAAAHRRRGGAAPASISRLLRTRRASSGSSSTRNSARHFERRHQIRRRACSSPIIPTPRMAPAKPPAAGARKPGDPHPFVIGSIGVEALRDDGRRVREQGLLQLNSRQRLMETTVASDSPRITARRRQKLETAAATLEGGD